MKFDHFSKLNLILLFTMLCANTYSQNTQIDTLTYEVTTSRPDLAVATTPKEDKIITKSIQRHIKNSATLSKLKIKVKTKKGIVTLSGKVNSDSEASSLVELAQSIIGVKEVDARNLKIKDSKQPFTDMIITAKIKGLFIREKVFGTKDIALINMSVETKNGIVYLTGTINNEAQIQNAIKLIKEIKGVKRVEYKLHKVMPNSSTSKDMP